MVDTLKVTDLDFESIKSNIKDYIRSNPEFTDYDFEAAGLSFIMDVLAYNTHYNAAYANFVANEMFLDTAVKRSSVISHAKALGYHPRGYSAARVKVNLTLKDIFGLAPDVWVLRRGTSFNTQINGNYYSFVTIKDYSATRQAGDVYLFDGVELIEGTYNTYAWIVQDDKYNTTYTIPNPRVDVSTCKLQTYPNASSLNPTEWNHSSTLTNIDNESHVYFTQENHGDRTDIYFGNGVIGLRPKINEIIKLEYVTCNGIEGNGAKVFSPMGSLLHNANPDIYARNVIIQLHEDYMSGSINGDNAESIDEIKFHASKTFTVQNRAVTPYDYMSIIRRDFNNVGAIKVWGGEDHRPPQYNSVMICIKPKTSDFITESEKAFIRNLLKNNSVMNIKPLFVDPEYLDLDIVTQVKFDPTKLSQSADLSQNIKNSLLGYSNMVLEKFGQNLNYSNLVSFIDSSNNAIVSNLTSVTLKKRIIPTIGRPNTYYIDFTNTIKNSRGSIRSSSFKTVDSDLDVFFINSGNNIVLGYNANNRFIVIKTVGNIDYINGTVYLNSLNITFADFGEIIIQAEPERQDITSELNNILRILPENINVSLVANTKTVNRIVAVS